MRAFRLSDPRVQPLRMDPVLKFALPILFAVALLGGGVILQIAKANAMALIRRSATLPERTPADLGLQFEPVTLTADDGLRLSAWYLPSTNGAAVIVQHGFRDTRDGMLEEAEILSRHGYGVLLLDARAHGESEGELITFGMTEVLDIRAAIDHLLSRSDVDSSRIGALGESQGAVTTLLACARYSEIRACVANGPYAALEEEIAAGVRTFAGLPPFPFAPLIRSYAEQASGFSAEDVAPIEHIDDIAPRAVFILQAGRDNLISADTGQRLFDAAGEPKELWFGPETGHTMFVHDHPREFEKRIVEFFDRYLLGRWG